MRLKTTFCAIAALVLAVSPACDDDDNNTNVDTGPLEITGTWTDNFGGTTVITETSVTTATVATVVSHDNAANWVVTQNAPDDPFFPDAFSKIVWTDVVTETGLREHWQCTVAFGEATQAAAEAAESNADATDLAGAGCGGFAWTGFRLPLSVAGTWASNFSETITISPFVWNTGKMARYDDAARWLVYQNPADDAFSPNTFSKVVWTEVTDGSFYTCTVAFGQDTADAAIADTTTADDSNPEVMGCGGFSWSRLSPPIAVAGDYTDDAGADVFIDSFMWGDYQVSDYDNGLKRAAVIEPMVGPGPPNGVSIAPTYSRLQWQRVGDTLSYCIAGTGFSNRAEALGTTPSVPAGAAVEQPPLMGCTEGPWTLTSK